MIALHAQPTSGRPESSRRRGTRDLYLTGHADEVLAHAVSDLSPQQRDSSPSPYADSSASPFSDLVDDFCDI